MTTHQADPAPAATTPLTPKDREMLAWYLGNRVESHHLTREDLDPAFLETWAASPHIARQIAAFRSLNTLADEFINTGARIDAMKAVSEDLRAATTSHERLRAVNAYIRLSTATSRAARHRAADTPRPPRDPDPTPRRPFGLPALPPLPWFGPSNTAGTTAVCPTTPHATGSPRPNEPNPGIAIPGFVDPGSAPDHPAPQSSPAPAAHQPSPAPTLARAPTAPSRSAEATTTPSAPIQRSPSRSSSSPSSPSSSTLSSPRPLRLLRSAPDSPADSTRRLTETSGAAPAGAWT